MNIQKNINLASYTTYQIGGPADFFVVVKTKDQLAQAILYARQNNLVYFVLGTGANILFGDKGFRGLVIKNEADNVCIESTRLIAESGAIVASLITKSVENGLSGFEHFAGIPSTVGGALWQNLHFLSPDRTETVFIESILESALILDKSNDIRTVNKDFFEFGYDTSILHSKHIVVLEATFTLTPKDKVSIQNQINENLKWRNDKQPPLESFPSCGSVFQKIEGVGAGRLIDQVGLKGFQIGGAQVSHKHANFIVNIGGATASDVVGVIDVIKEKVLRETGYRLKTEISFVGEF